MRADGDPTGNVFGLDPMLAPLGLESLGGIAFVYGPVHELVSGSPAIDAGNPSGCTDHLGAVLFENQQGLRRPLGGRCDMGASEWTPVCLGGVQTREAKLVLRNLGPPLGDERLSFRGGMQFGVGQPFSFEPPALGARPRWRTRAFRARRSST